MTHIRIVHSMEPGFSIPCSVDGCRRTFTNFRTYQNHQLTHSTCSHEAADTGTLTNSDENADDNFCTDHDSSSLHRDLSSNKENSPAAANTISHDSMQSFAAKWILKMSETKCLMRAAATSMITDMSDLLEFVVQTLNTEVNHALGEDSQVASKLREIFSSPVTKPFDGIETFHRQIRYYQENFNLIVSSFIENIISMVHYV